VLDRQAFDGGDDEPGRGGCLDPPAADHVELDASAGERPRW